MKLKPILLDLNVYDKPSLKETILGIIYRLKHIVFLWCLPQLLWQSQYHI